MPPSSSIEIKEQIQTSLAAFDSQSLPQAARALFATLGYNSQRDERVLKIASPADFIGWVKSANPASMLSEKDQHELTAGCNTLHFLFQLTDVEVGAALGQGQADLFDSHTTVDGSRYESYLFFTAELADTAAQSRTAMARLVRLINKPLPMPAMILFRQGETVTLAVINRRLHKSDASRDVLEKVTLIKDIAIAKPHRAHIEILHDLSVVSLKKVQGITSFVTLHNAWRKVLDISELNRSFYRKLFNWYLYAVKTVIFPNPDKLPEEVNNSINVIRLLTRLIFCWFIKEKGLIPDELFEEKELAKILVGANGVRPDTKAESKVGACHAPLQGTYYKAILQNLFFATLNTEMNRDNPGSRRFITEEKVNGVNPDYNNFTVYRHKNLFNDPEVALKLFENIPFLNGGLFECLDTVETVEGKNRETRYDGFSSTASKQPVVPNTLFFGQIANVDFSNEYGGKSGNHETVTGLIDILNSYKFTIAENTPLEVEVALDPELLGKVFENLLASYNPETRSTARNQTGSFYTPREIVNYMVDESLKAYLSAKIEESVGAKQASSASPAFGGDPGKGEAGESFASPLQEKLLILFSHTDTGNPFADNEELTDQLIKAISNANILDPACGSGAFPMGVLHRMVHILGKLDPNNRKWKQAQIDIVEEDRKKAEELRDETVREGALKSVEERLAYIEASFDCSHHELDYLRKLFLIENCIYGVDIQNIAVQIAKLRFFISLIVEQKKDSSRPNLGILAMPNLETKFVAADSLIALERPQQLDLGSHVVEKAEFELRQVRERVFYARKYKDKKELRKQEKVKREALEKALVGSNWGKAEAHQVAAWNPFDVSSSAPFFDPEMMFGIKTSPPTTQKTLPPLQGEGRGGDGVGGFNIVIGNPPYIQIQSFSGMPQQKAWEAQKYASYTKTGDVYCLFYERGFQLLAPNGVLTYITSNKWMRANYGKGLRKFFLEHGRIAQLIDFGDSQLFENATTYTNILVWNSEKSKLPSHAWDLSKVYSADVTLETLLEKEGVCEPLLSEDAFSVTKAAQSSIKQQIEKIGLPLKKWDITINYGIKTGLNEAFIVSGKKKDEIIIQDPKSAEIIKPILRGRDIKQYKEEFADYWLINVHNGYGNVPRINVQKDYPAIWEYLNKLNHDTNGAIEKRQDQGDHWTNLRSCAYVVEFLKDKIIWLEMSPKANFTYDIKGAFVLNTAYILTGTNLKYLLAIINSSVLDFYFPMIATEVRGSTRRYIKQYVENLPIPKLPPATQLPYECLVDCTLFAHESGLTAEAATFEWVINVMVYGLYFEEEMKKADCYINDRVAEVVKPFKPEDTDEFKAEYVQKLNLFFLADKDIYRGLIHSRTVGPVEIINEARKK